MSIRQSWLREWGRKETKGKLVQGFNSCFFLFRIPVSSRHLIMQPARKLEFVRMKQIEITEDKWCTYILCHLPRNSQWLNRASSESNPLVLRIQNILCLNSSHSPDEMKCKKASEVVLEPGEKSPRNFRLLETEVEESQDWFVLFQGMELNMLEVVQWGET